MRANNDSGARCRFLESMDSVRHVSSAPDTAFGHLLVEALISMLFGEPFLVPLPYSFDSRGFLRLSEALLDGRGSIPGHRRDPSSPVFHPFLLSGWGDESWREFVGMKMEQEGRRFELSGWPRLDADQDRRNAAAKYVRDGEFSGGTPPELYEYEWELSCLQRLDIEFKNDRRRVDAARASTRLADYTNWVRSSSCRFGVVGDEFEPYVRAMKDGLRRMGAMAYAHGEQQEEESWL